MGERTEKSVEMFGKGFNCAQAVFAAFRDPAQIDEKTALRMTTAFGGGVAGLGDSICGAVSGGLLAISMKYGRTDASDAAAKQKTYELSRKFMEDFTKKHGSCVCENILGFNVSAPGQENRSYREKCTEAVRHAAELLEEII